MNRTELFAAAAFRRGTLLDDERTTCCRLFSGEAEGIDGLYVDKLGPAAIANIYEGTEADGLDVRELAREMLAAWNDRGVESVYHKRFPRDRSHAGQLDASLTDPAPTAGEQQPEAIRVREHGLTYLVRPYDGFSTGLFLDQRENRAWLRNIVRRSLERRPESEPPMRVCNTFAYTGAFGLCAAAASLDDPRLAGRVSTTNVDVSERYLAWAKDNYRATGLDPEAHHFPRADARDFLSMSARRGWLFGAIVLDPPTFGSADKKRRIPPWRAERDYPALVESAAAVLEPDGVLLCSTNTAALCEPGELERSAVRGLGARPAGGVLRGRTATFDVLDLPAPGKDVELEAARFAAFAVMKRP